MRLRGDRFEPYDDRGKIWRSVSGDFGWQCSDKNVLWNFKLCVIFLKNTGKGKQMEDIIEEFGSGFLTITVTLFLVGYWYENMRQGGAVYEFVQQFLNCICGG